MTTNNISTILDKLRARKGVLPQLIAAERGKRGPLALAVAVDRSRAGELAKLDEAISALTREQVDNSAAITEAERQMQEAVAHSRVEAARQAQKRFPAESKRVIAAYENISQLLEALSAALIETRAAEKGANEVADLAAPFDPEFGDDSYSASARTFSCTDSMDVLCQQACSEDKSGFPWTIQERLTYHLDRVSQAILAASERRIHQLEQKIVDERRSALRAA